MILGFQETTFFSKETVANRIKIRRFLSKLLRKSFRSRYRSLLTDMNFMNGRTNGNSVKVLRLYQQIFPNRPARSS